MIKKGRKPEDYQPLIPGGKDIRQRVEQISERTGKKMYIVIREAMEAGLSQMEAAR